MSDPLRDRVIHRIGALALEADENAAQLIEARQQLENTRMLLAATQAELAQLRNENEKLKADPAAPEEAAPAV